VATHLGDDVVTLRRWRASDAAWYAQCVQDDDIQRFTSEPRTLTAAAVADAIVASAGDLRSQSFLVADSRDGSRLGNIALQHEDGVGHVSYWVAADARGRGVARRALALLSSWAFEKLQLDELRLWTHAANASSPAAAEHAGFHRDPAGDRPRTVKDETWPTVAYRVVPAHHDDRSARHRDRTAPGPPRP